MEVEISNEYVASKKEYWDSYSVVTTSYNKGHAEGIQEGMEIGMEKGMKKGMKKGIQKGREEERRKNVQEKLESARTLNPNRSLGPISSGDVKVFSCSPESKECLPLIYGSHKT